MGAAEGSEGRIDEVPVEPSDEVDNCFKVVCSSAADLAETLRLSPHRVSELELPSSPNAASPNAANEMEEKIDARIRELQFLGYRLSC